MNRIILYKTLPDVFASHPDIVSDIWEKETCFEKGNHYLIEASSGTGKSSLCSFIYGYRSDYSGEILFDEIDIKRLKVEQWDKIRCNNLSLLFQELNLFPELTAWENVLLKNNLTHYKNDVQIDSMFKELGIDTKKNEKAGAMSWGQQQRVAIIRSLCQPFDFLILDEPISHLDDNNAAIMAKLIHQEAKQQGASIIATSIGKHLPLEYTKIFSL